VAERTDIPNKLRHAVMREAGYRCAVPTCGTTLAIDLHHIWEVQHGGGDEISNLIALCPTHHALYHRKFISADSIAEWKSRLIAINQVGSETIHKILSQLLSSRGEGSKTSESGFDGFPLSTAEFMQRTCEVGFIAGHEGEMFVRTGLCCFVSQGVAFTMRCVVEAAFNGADLRLGRPVIHTRRGMAPFEVLERHEIGELVSIKMGAVDDTHVKELLADHGPEIAGVFHDPLQTDVRCRFAAHVGETVGFLSCSRSENDWQAGIPPFRFENSAVSFTTKGMARKEFAQFVLTPFLGRVEYAGAPVFTENGNLVGMIRDSIELPNEIGCRPLITNVIPVKKFLGSITKNSQQAE